jgi:anti-sigma factor RsiW
MTGQQLASHLNPHLSDDQFSDLLIGDCSLEVRRHVDACPQCQNEFKLVQSAIDGFGATSLQWAEEREPRSISPSSQLFFQCRSLGTWAAAALLAAAVLFEVHQGWTVGTPVANNVETQAVESPADVAGDNRLMMAIDQEIRWQAKSPLSLATPEKPYHSRPPRRLAN